MQEALSERKHNVLVNAVEDYIKDASPITSGSVKQRHLQHISSATLRNELNALEAMGYLKQVHTSGGRIPTIAGYRYYVNKLLENTNFDKTTLKNVKKLLDNRTNSLIEIIQELTKLISKAVNYPTVIYTNGYDKLTIKSIKIFPLVDKQALTLIETESGYITNTIQTTANAKSCEDASKYLTKNYKGKIIKEMLDTIEEKEKDMLDEIQSFRIVIDNLIYGMRKVFDEQKLSIRTDGSSMLLAENNETAEQTKKVLKLLDNEKVLEKAMEITDVEKDLTVSLVEEESYNGCAVVKAPIVIDGKAVASIGVIGPQRMNYATIASALKIVTSELNSSTTKKKEKKNGTISNKFKRTKT